MTRAGEFKLLDYLEELGATRRGSDDIQLFDRAANPDSSDPYFVSLIDWCTDLGTRPTPPAFPLEPRRAIEIDACLHQRPDYAAEARNDWASPGFNKGAGGRRLSDLAEP